MRFKEIFNDSSSEIFASKIKINLNGVKRDIGYPFNGTFTKLIDPNNNEHSLVNLVNECFDSTKDSEGYLLLKLITIPKTFEQIAYETDKLKLVSKIADEIGNEPIVE